jgi:hypothetical protein
MKMGDLRETWRRVNGPAGKTTTGVLAEGSGRRVCAKKVDRTYGAVRIRRTPRAPMDYADNIGADHDTRLVDCAS